MKNLWKLCIGLSFVLLLGVAGHSQTRSDSSRAEQRDLPILMQRRSALRVPAAPNRVFTERGVYMPEAVFSASMQKFKDPGGVVMVQGGGSSSWLQWAHDTEHTGFIPIAGQSLQ